MPPEQFTLTVEALPSWGGVPATIRLKRFLKAALRSYGLRCTEAKEITPATLDRLPLDQAPPATTPAELPTDGAAWIEWEAEAAAAAGLPIPEMPIPGWKPAKY